MYSLAEKERFLRSGTRQILLACRDTMRAKYPTAGIVLYGSQARGGSDPESDIDLLILLNEQVTTQQKRLIHDMLYEIGLAQDAVISIIVRSRGAWDSPISQATPLYQAICKEGIQVI